MWFKNTYSESLLLSVNIQRISQNKGIYTGVDCLVATDELCISDCGKDNFKCTKRRSVANTNFKID